MISRSLCEINIWYHSAMLWNWIDQWWLIQSVFWIHSLPNLSKVLWLIFNFLRSLSFKFLLVHKHVSIAADPRTFTASLPIHYVIDDELLAQFLPKMFKVQTALSWRNFSHHCKCITFSLYLCASIRAWLSWRIVKDCIGNAVWFELLWNAIDFESQVMT